MLDSYLAQLAEIARRGDARGERLVALQERYTSYHDMQIRPETAADFWTMVASLAAVVTILGGLIVHV